MGRSSGSRSYYYKVFHLVGSPVCLHFGGNQTIVAYFYITGDVMSLIAHVNENTLINNKA